MVERSKKRSGLEIKKKIITSLSDNKFHSFGDLERKVNSDWQSIRRHCEELEYFEIIIISDEGIKLSEKGQEFLKKN